MVEKIETLLMLLGLVGVLSVVAERLRFPFPILLVISGLGIAFLPNLPVVKLDPELVLLIFLPPLVFSAAWNFPWEDFRANLIPIFALAVGLVLATMVGVGYAAQWLVPGMTLAAGMVLGAIVSPPDAVAANSVLKNLRVPKRLSTILEGESLINDSSGLVAYQFAVAALVTGSFSLSQAGADFVWESLGGVAFGWGVGWVVAYIHRELSDAAVQVTLTILTPYIAYLPCEHFGCSGVLAVVTAGLHLGHHAWETLSPETRLQRETIWRFIDYLLNGVVFILIGLQFPAIWAGLAGDWNPFVLILLGVGISLVVVAIRFAWIFPLALLQRLLFSAIRQQERLPWRELVAASWAGMRGVVSLAAAMALPETTSTGEPFPFRQLILFLTFFVIFVTLVFQGLTLPWLMRRLRVEEPEETYLGEARARLVLMEELVDEIEKIIATKTDEAEKASLRLWRDNYAQRAHHLQIRIESPQLQSERIFDCDMTVFPELFQKIRSRLAQMRSRGEISEEMRKRIEYDFDLEDRRLHRLIGRYARSSAPGGNSR